MWIAAPSLGLSSVALCANGSSSDLEMTLFRLHRVLSHMDVTPAAGTLTIAPEKVINALASENTTKYQDYFDAHGEDLFCRFEAGHWERMAALDYSFVAESLLRESVSTLERRLGVSHHCTLVITAASTQTELAATRHSTESLFQQGGMLFFLHPPLLDSDDPLLRSANQLYYVGQQVETRTVTDLDEWRQQRKRHPTPTSNLSSSLMAYKGLVGRRIHPLSGPSPIGIYAADSLRLGRLHIWGGSLDQLHQLPDNELNNRRHSIDLLLVGGKMDDAHRKLNDIIDAIAPALVIWNHPSAPYEDNIGGIRVYNLAQAPGLHSMLRFDPQQNIVNFISAPPTFKLYLDTNQRIKTRLSEISSDVALTVIDFIAGIKGSELSEETDSSWVYAKEAVEWSLSAAAFYIESLISRPEVAESVQHKQHLISLIEDRINENFPNESDQAIRALAFRLLVQLSGYLQT